jgi:hypothetical protein
MQERKLPSNRFILCRILDIESPANDGGRDRTVGAFLRMYLASDTAAVLDFVG